MAHAPCEFLAAADRHGRVVHVADHVDEIRDRFVVREVPRVHRPVAGHAVRHERLPLSFSKALAVSFGRQLLTKGAGVAQGTQARAHQPRRLCSTHTRIVVFRSAKECTPSLAPRKSAYTLSFAELGNTRASRHLRCSRGRWLP